jgi:orotate phosphoribosyltransferase
MRVQPSSAPERMSAERLVALLRDCGALLEGHFRLTSGLHSPVYLQCARLLMDPARAAMVCAALEGELARALPGQAFDATVAPAMGGIVFGYELARQIGVLALFVERAGGEFALRRGFALEPGARVLIAEDVVTTGLSVREAIACVRAHGADVVAAACLIDRSGGSAQLDVPLIALAQLDLPVYAPDQIPPDLATKPVVKPGSRPIIGA